MIDMHSQVFPGVEDGPKTMEESIDFIKMAIKEGITDIISTYHFNQESKQSIEQKTVALRAELVKNQLQMTIHIGQKIDVEEDVVEKLKTREALTLADSKYVLLELPSYHIPENTVKMIQGLCSMNKVPIISKPERNASIMEKPSRLAKLVNQGALAQVTAGSLAGYFGRNVQKLSVELIQANLIHTYGSDSYNSKMNPLLFNKGLNFLEKRNMSDAVDLLLENNARILTNEDLILLEPIKLNPKKWWRLSV